jgi:hypothetical protein
LPTARLNDFSGAILNAAPLPGAPPDKLMIQATISAQTLTLSAAEEGEPEWTIAVAEGVCWSQSSPTLYILTADPNNDIVSFDFDQAKTAFVPTPRKYDSTLPISDRFAQAAYCTHRWLLQVDPQISALETSISTTPDDGRILILSNKTEGQSMAVALSNGFAAAIPSPVATEYDYRNYGQVAPRKWLLRLAKGIDANPVGDGPNYTLDCNMNFNIVAQPLPQPAEIVFLITPIPPQNARICVEGAPMLEIKSKPEKV